MISKNTNLSHFYLKTSYDIFETILIQSLQKKLEILLFIYLDHIFNYIDNVNYINFFYSVFYKYQKAKKFYPLLKKAIFF